MAKKFTITRISNNEIVEICTKKPSVVNGWLRGDNQTNYNPEEFVWTRATKEDIKEWNNQ